MNSDMVDHRHCEENVWLQFLGAINKGLDMENASPIPSEIIDGRITSIGDSELPPSPLPHTGVGSPIGASS